MAVTKELLQMDLYALLGIEEKAADKEVKKAYRQKALSCHPDKNPDNPRAAELFHQLSQALEVLTDAAARAAYDKVRKAKKQAAERTQRLDENRKKVKLDLEARERQAQAHGSEEEEESRSATTLEQEIARLREEGSRQLEEQQRLIQEQIRRDREQRLRGETENTEGKGTPKLKLKWKCKKEDDSQGGYSRDVLLRLLQKYGEVLNLVLSRKKAGNAIVEFATVRAAELAVRNEVGLADNPLKVSWLEGQPQSTVDPSPPGLSKFSDDFPVAVLLVVTTSSAGLAKYAALSMQSPWPPQSDSLEKGGIAEGAFPPGLHGAPESHLVGLASEKPHKGAQQQQGSVLSERDYESLVMMRMRQAAERQQLIAQMQQEDEGRPT